MRTETVKDTQDDVNSDEEKIKVRAYLRWEEEGRPEGRHLDHWELAKKEINRGAENNAANSDLLASPKV